VRPRVLESPEFERAKTQRAVVRAPALEVIRSQWHDILLAAFVRLSEQAPFYLFVTFVLTYATQQLQLARGDLLNYMMVAAAVGLISVPLFGYLSDRVPLFGYLSDRIGRRLMYGIGIVCVGLFAFPYYALLNTKIDGLVLVAIVLSLIFHDMEYGPQAALIAETFGTNVRYSGAGMGYQLASVIAGGPAPLIAAAILEKTGSSAGIAWYIIGCCVISLTALWLMPDRVSVERRLATAAGAHG